MNCTMLIKSKLTSGVWRCAMSGLQIQFRRFIQKTFKKWPNCRNVFYVTKLIFYLEALSVVSSLLQIWICRQPKTTIRVRFEHLLEHHFCKIFKLFLQILFSENHFLPYLLLVAVKSVPFIPTISTHENQLFTSEYKVT